jgi:hypothetical protein
MAGKLATLMLAGVEEAGVEGGLGEMEKQTVSEWNHCYPQKIVEAPRTVKQE